MKHVIPLILLSLFSHFILVSQPVIQWQKSFGATNQEYGGIVAPTSDGGYIISGTSSSNDEYGYVVQTSDGGYIVSSGSESVVGDITDHYGAIDSTIGLILRPIRYI